MFDAFKQVFDETGLNHLTKVTNLHKIAIIRVYLLKCLKEDIILMSKHSTEKVDNSYLPEFTPRGLHAGAGFEAKKAYVISRGNLTYPSEWVNKLFPYLQTWQKQTIDILGYDNGSAANNFLHGTVYSFAYCIIQDGIYIVDSYPDHYWTKLIFDKIGKNIFKEYSKKAREEVKKRSDIIEEHNSLVSDSKNNPQDKVVSLEKLMLKLELHMAKLESIVNELLLERESNSNIMDRRAYSSIQLPPRPSMVELPPQANEPIEVNHRRESNTTVAIATSLPRIPSINTYLHPTFKQNLKYWREEKLGEYTPHQLNCSKANAGWSKHLEKRWGKRKRIHEIIINASENNEEEDALDKAADDLDSEMNSNKNIMGVYKDDGIPRTITQYIEMEKNK